jgi:hypothetical protein
MVGVFAGPEHFDQQLHAGFGGGLDVREMVGHEKLVGVVGKGLDQVPDKFVADLEQVFVYGAGFVLFGQLHDQEPPGVIAHEEPSLIEQLLQEQLIAGHREKVSKDSGGLEVPVLLGDPEGHLEGRSRAVPGDVVEAGDLDRPDILAHPLDEVEAVGQQDVGDHCVLGEGVGWLLEGLYQFQEGRDRQTQGGQLCADREQVVDYLQQVHPGLGGQQVVLEQLVREDCQQQLDFFAGHRKDIFESLEVDAHVDALAVPLVGVEGGRLPEDGLPVCPPEPLIVHLAGQPGRQPPLLDNHIHLRINNPF